MEPIRQAWRRLTSGSLRLLAWPLGRIMAEVETGLWKGDMAAPDGVARREPVHRPTATPSDLQEHRSA